MSPAKVAFVSTERADLTERVRLLLDDESLKLLVSGGGLEMSGSGSRMLPRAAV